MAKITPQDAQLVKVLENSFRDAKASTYLLNTEYPMIVEFAGRKRRMTAWRKVANGSLYLKVMVHGKDGPFFQLFVASRSSGLKDLGTISLVAYADEARRVAISEFDNKFSNLIATECQAPASTA